MRASPRPRIRCRRGPRDLPPRFAPLPPRSWPRWRPRAALAAAPRAALAAASSVPLAAAPKQARPDEIRAGRFDRRGGGWGRSRADRKWGFFGGGEGSLWLQR